MKSKSGSEPTWACPVVSQAMEKEGFALADVPMILRTEELCLIAVSTYGVALKHVPMALRTEKICLTALTCQNRWMSNECVLDFVPESLKTTELCRVAVKQRGEWLQAVPEALKTAELCEIAVRQNGQALAFVPEDLKTEKLCLLALAYGLEAFNEMPRAFMDSIATQALAQGIASTYTDLHRVEKNRRTLPVCLFAMKQDAEKNLPHLPSEIVVQAFQQLMIKVN